MATLGGENSVDLITVAQAVHWFNLPDFYSLVGRLLQKPGGLLAVWAYQTHGLSPAFDPILGRLLSTTMLYRNPNVQYMFDQYRMLPFPFESVGLGSEGSPCTMDLHREVSFDGFVREPKLLRGL